MQQRSSSSIVLAVSAAALSAFFAVLPASTPASAGAWSSPGVGEHSDSGSPPPEMRLRAIVSRALDDAVVTWTRRLEGRAPEVAQVEVQFVSRLAPANCYGLYTGDGPAYCSGNQTVFVGTDSAGQLMSKFGRYAEAGMTFLIGHEIGHHIQNLFGRFVALGQAMRAAPEDGPELVRRFELQADCLAGVWMHDSPAWATSDQFRADVLAVLHDIGDDVMLRGMSEARIQQVGLHGTGKQRTRWFLRGALSGDVDACNTFEHDSP